MFGVQIISPKNYLNSAFLIINIQAPNRLAHSYENINLL